MKNEPKCVANVSMERKEVWGKLIHPFFRSESTGWLSGNRFLLFSQFDHLLAYIYSRYANGNQLLDKFLE